MTSVPLVYVNKKAFQLEEQKGGENETAGATRITTEITSLFLKEINSLITILYELLHFGLTILSGVTINLISHKVMNRYKRKH